MNLLPSQHSVHIIPTMDKVTISMGHHPGPSYSNSLSVILNVQCLALHPTPAGLDHMLALGACWPMLTLLSTVHHLSHPNAGHFWPPTTIKPVHLMCCFSPEPGEVMVGVYLPPGSPVGVVKDPDLHLWSPYLSRHPALGQIKPAITGRTLTLMWVTSGCTNPYGHSLFTYYTIFQSLLSTANQG